MGLAKGEAHIISLYFFFLSAADFRLTRKEVYYANIVVDCSDNIVGPVYYRDWDRYRSNIAIIGGDISITSDRSYSL